MGKYVRVGSVDKLKEFRESLCMFSHAVGNAFGDAQSEIQRTITWLKQDQHAYWKTQLRHRSERLAKAKLDLKRKKEIERSPLGGRQTYSDEEKAYAVAKSNFDDAQAKLDAVKHWILRLEKETYTYRGLVRGLGAMLESDIPNARAKMDGMIDSLEAYAALEPAAGMPVGAPDPIEVSAAMTRSPDATADAPDLGWRELRKQTPCQETREQIPMQAAAMPWLKGDTIPADVRQAIDEINHDPVSVSPDEKVIIADLDSEPQSFYAERSSRCSAGDSGWYLGSIHPQEAPEHHAVRIADLLAMRPDLAEILTLPAGYLVLLAGADIEAIVNASDELVPLAHH